MWLWEENPRPSGEIDPIIDRVFKSVAPSGVLWETNRTVATVLPDLRGGQLRPKPRRKITQGPARMNGALRCPAQSGSGGI
jgi:hypothetical protein